MLRKLANARSDANGKVEAIYMACALTETCIFFNDKMADMPSMANMYKQRYCMESFETCARYSVFKAVGRENVPRDLYPNESNKVERVIAGASK